jgi:cytochrome c biogenesis protein CcmG, thiol:disulfide interchange protein DsbE
VVVGEGIVEAMTGRRWIAYAWIAAAFVVMTFVWHFGGMGAGGITPVGERKAMAEVVLTELDGKTWRLAEHRGQVVLVNYWATWCGPCREEMPGLVRLSRELGPQGLAVVGVALDEGGEEKVKRFVEELRVDYPVVMPEKMSQVEFGLEGLPATVLVDREGRVAKIYVGAVREPDFRADVEALLMER